MPFRCPACDNLATLEIVSSIELPPDNRSDEIAVQTLRCSACGFHGLAVYEESRRGAFGSEAVDHTGYRLEEADLARVSDWIARCPRPSDPGCHCPSQQILGRQDSTGRWQGLNEVALSGSFTMELG